MPKWLSYLVLIPGLIIAIKMAFGMESYNTENIGLASILIFVGMVLMGMSQAENLTPSERKEIAQEMDVNFAFTRLMATSLVSLCMLGFSLYILYEKPLDSSFVFWFSLPFLFILLTIKYYSVWRLKRFLYVVGQIGEGRIVSFERQIHHRQGNVYLHVVFEFEVPDMGVFHGQATCPYSPYISYEPGSVIQVLYDPKNPAKNLLLSAWHGKGLQSKKEYYMKLARPDEKKDANSFMERQV